MDVTKEQLDKLKKAELDILEKFIEVCKNLHLKYYVIGGTLIGAIRHQGFIPWDDDIDLAMPREDYEIFIREAQKYLPDHLFIQCIETENEYVQTFAKIRNSDTTFIETAAKHLNMNHGVYIDIFPLDYFPENPKFQKRILRKKKIYTRRICAVFESKESSFKSRVISKLLTICYPSTRAIVEKRNELLKSCQKSTIFANHGGAWGIKEIAPVEWFGEGTVVSFEGIDIVAPSGYHQWLTQVYGDYMQLPPEEKRVAHHYVDVIDLERTYKDYMR